MDRSAEDVIEWAIQAEAFDLDIASFLLPNITQWIRENLT
jgi:hypothetical protein